MARPLTRRQYEVLEFIESYYNEWGYAPTLEEIRAALGLASVATVHKHLRALEQKGAVRREWNRTRSVELVEADSVQAPLLGLVAAGQPIEVAEAPEMIDIPPQMMRSENTYVLRVCGDSMIDEQIADGDLVVVEPRNIARNGELVVALVDGDCATLKRFYQEGPMARLVPANPRVQPILVPAERVQIRGVVVGLLRAY